MGVSIRREHAPFASYARTAPRFGATRCRTSVYAASGAYLRKRGGMFASMIETHTMSECKVRKRDRACVLTGIVWIFQNVDDLVLSGIASMPAFPHAPTKSRGPVHSLSSLLWFAKPFCTQKGM